MPIAVSQGRQKLYSYLRGRPQYCSLWWTGQYLPSVTEESLLTARPTTITCRPSGRRSVLLSSPLFPQPHSHHPALFHPAGFEEGSALGKGRVLMQQAGFTSQILMLITRKAASSQDLLDWTGPQGGTCLPSLPGFSSVRPAASRTASPHRAQL